jgi:hypothetical protein
MVYDSAPVVQHSLHVLYDDMRGSKQFGKSRQASHQGVAGIVSARTIVQVGATLAGRARQEKVNLADCVYESFLAERRRRTQRLVQQSLHRAAQGLCAWEVECEGRDAILVRVHGKDRLTPKTDRPTRL